MKTLNPISKLLIALLFVHFISCEDETTEIGSNLQVVPQQMLTANINYQGTIKLIPQMLMAQGGEPNESYSWEIDTSYTASERIKIGATDGIVTLLGNSAAGFKTGTTYFRVLVSDGEFTNRGMIGIKITDHKLDPVSDVQQLQEADFQLMNGASDQHYCASLFVMGGTPPYTFSMDSVYTAELDKYGLSIDPEYGLISGKIPKNAVPRLLSFRVDIRDSRGKTALYNPIYKIRVR
jgi:hypothetical protein